MNLSDKPDFLIWPNSHYLFIEKVGPFQQTAPAAWGELHKRMNELQSLGKIKSMTSFYKLSPQQIYCAGAILEAKPTHVPAGFSYLNFAGGRYARFTLKGSYSQLPEACGKAFAWVEKNKLQQRNDFYLENYVNDPKTTAEDQLITEILIPAQ